jgi:uncharacterized protein (TIGR02058 family)
LVVVAVSDYRRYIVEVGTGVDLHGEDATEAARRAVRDAIGRVSMVGLMQLFDAPSFREVEDALMVDVTVALPRPEAVDRDAVLSVLPEGRRRITLVEGGMRFPTPQTAEEARTHGILVAVAVIVVLVDVSRIPFRTG